MKNKGFKSGKIQDWDNKMRFHLKSLSSLTAEKNESITAWFIMLLSKVCHWRWRLCDDTISWDIFQETSGCCFYHYCHYFQVIGSASRLSARQKHCFLSGWKKSSTTAEKESDMKPALLLGDRKWKCGADESAGLQKSRGQTHAHSCENKNTHL